MRCCGPPPVDAVGHTLDEALAIATRCYQTAARPRRMREAAVRVQTRGRTRAAPSPPPRAAATVKPRKGKARDLARARYTAERSARRAAARANRRCLHCGKRLKAQRSTAKFCSSSCRAWHWLGKKRK
jgi:hypothetical protein